MSEFTIKDSGERQEFAGGMVRDTTEGKINFLSVRFGPMFRRWADHLTKGRKKYPDVSAGTPNWTLAQGVEEYLRAKESAARHFEDWLEGKRDEDHAAGVFFNINLAEYVLERMDAIDPGLGAKVISEASDGEPEPEFIPGPGEGACHAKSPAGWYCERPIGHSGDHRIEPGRYMAAGDAEESWPR